MDTVDDAASSADGLTYSAPQVLPTGGGAALEPVRKKKAGRELGNAAAAAALCVDPATGRPISPQTFQWYVRTGRPANNPAPRHVEIDNETGQRMYALKEVRAWQARRVGRGNWGGIGARARRKDDQPDLGPPAVEPTSPDTTD